MLGCNLAKDRLSVFRPEDLFGVVVLAVVSVVYGLVFDLEATLCVLSLLYLAITARFSVRRELLDTIES